MLQCLGREQSQLCDSNLCFFFLQFIQFRKEQEGESDGGFGLFVESESTHSQAGGKFCPVNNHWALPQIPGPKADQRNNFHFSLLWFRNRNQMMAWILATLHLHPLSQHYPPHRQGYTECVLNFNFGVSLDQASCLGGFEELWLLVISILFQVFRATT